MIYDNEWRIGKAVDALGVEVELNGCASLNTESGTIEYYVKPFEQDERGNLKRIAEKRPAPISVYDAVQSKRRTTR